MSWKNYFVCKCSYKEETHFTDHFFKPNICPDCGSGKYAFTVQTMRWVSDAELMNPLTWFSGHWKTKED